MALEDEVQNRYSSQILINVSNPQNTGATSLDSARLGRAADDVEAWFKIRVGVAYDNTVDTHIAVAVEGVFIRLQVLTGHLPMDRWEEWKNGDLRDLALVTGRDRVSPDTDSALDPTQDITGEKPAFDRQAFDGFHLKNPDARSLQQD